jgi:hypothetical protein
LLGGTLPETALPPEKESAVYQKRLCLLGLTYFYFDNPFPKGQRQSGFSSGEGFGKSLFDIAFDAFGIVSYSVAIT